MRMKVNVSGSTFYCTSDTSPVLSTYGQKFSAQDKILIFSREPDLRILLKTLLELWGLPTVETDSLDESLEIVERQKPRLILLDSVLPFEKHLETIRQIRRCKFSKGIPIIVLSGFSQPEFKNSTLAVGADGFLVKPLDFDQLESYLKKKIDNYTKKLH